MKSLIFLLSSVATFGCALEQAGPRLDISSGSPIFMKLGDRERIRSRYIEDVVCTSGALVVTRYTPERLDPGTSWVVAQCVGPFIDRNLVF